MKMRFTAPTKGGGGSATGPMSGVSSISIVRSTGAVRSAAATARFADIIKLGPEASITAASTISTRA